LTMAISRSARRSPLSSSSSPSQLFMSTPESSDPNVLNKWSRYDRGNDFLGLIFLIWQAPPRSLF
jgi:hypothetical protein